MALISAVYGNGPKLSKKQAKRRKEVQRALKLHVKSKPFRERLVRMATPAELAFQQILFALKIRHQFQREMRRKGGRYAIVDFYLPDYHAIIEIDGGYHNDVIQKHLDKRRTKEILNNNKIPEKVVRFTNKEVLDAPEQAAQRLVKELEGE